MLEAEDEGVKNCDDLTRLLSRIFQEPNPEVQIFVEEQFSEVVQRFDSAILRLPNQVSGKPEPLSTGGRDFFLEPRRFLPTAGPPRSRYSGDGRDRSRELAPDLSG